MQESKPDSVRTPTFSLWRSHFWSAVLRTAFPRTRAMLKESPINQSPETRKTVTERSRPLIGRYRSEKAGEENGNVHT